MDIERTELIKFYFGLGFTQKEILMCLAVNHGIVVSERHLRRLLRKQGLFRRKMQSDVFTVAAFVEQELLKSGKLHGYRWMHVKCIQHGFVVTQSTVRILLLLMDPEGVAARRRHCLTHRTYRNPGANHTFHIDGYDKLKPYGLCIHGCVDGYSRKVVWLEVHSSNNDPRIVAGYFLSAVTELQGCPLRIRGDFGTGNWHVAGMQRYLRRNGEDGLAGEKSFQYGKSTTNQRIEGWWTTLRKHCSQFWMDLLHGLKENGTFSGTFLDKSLIQFCFMRIMQVMRLSLNWVY